MGRQRAWTSHAISRQDGLFGTGLALFGGKRMEFTVENICGLLIRSKLLSPDQVKAMYHRWLADVKESKDAANLGQFSKWLTANRYLTEYQATLITRGHADDF